ncbi:conserved hypothetical protein [Burkholderiales bacterium 8X]|nr:conserved hypothetical protein [Burkholderiales bacterium 8X]
MKHFTLDSSMIATIGGAFYPTGYSMVMFPDKGDAEQVARDLEDGGLAADDVMLIPPETLLSTITPTVSDADNPMPSAGTDASTVRAFTKLAREGHTALLVKTDDDGATKLVDRIKRTKYSIAQRYRMLVIEDL